LEKNTMTGALPAPLVPSEVDLRDFGFMPLDVLRLRDSDLATVATGDEFRAAVLLWCASWHQQPAASLPDDDRMLRKLAGMPDRWARVKKGALRGFVKCSDGRLYHRVLAEKALESWTKKVAQRDRTRAATAARHRRDASAPVRDGERNGLRNGDRNEVQGTVKGQGEVREHTERVRAIPSPAPAPIQTGETPPGGAEILRDAAIAEILAEYPKNPHNPAHVPLAERQIGMLLDGRIVDAPTLKANVIAFRQQQDAMRRTGTQYVPKPATFFTYPRGPWQGPFEIPEDPDASVIDPSARSWKPGAA
jgi:hypothetical protein